MAEAISERGKVVGSSWEALPHGGGLGLGFLWQNGQMRGLRSLPRGDASSAYDINGYGWVVGSSGDLNGTHAVLWTLKP